jgi:AbrB family looped-hinge helix DNA binding protein
MASIANSRYGGPTDAQRLTYESRGITLTIKYYIRRMTMATTVTVKGQVTLPKSVRDAAGIKPGDKVEVRATASGGVYIEKRGTSSAYGKRLLALAERRLIRGATTDQIMRELRGDPARDPKL